MTANPSLIDTMADSIVKAGRSWLDAQKNGYLGWADVPDRVFARAALQALLEAGPTIGLREAIAADLEEADNAL